MFFRDIHHQDRALSILRRALGSGRTHHAYLFDGPDGVGKERTARALSARLLCRGDEAAEGAALPGLPTPEGGMDACGACASCRLFASGNHPDLHVIERSLHRAHPDARIRAQRGIEIGIDLVRHFLIDHAAASPTLGRRRVFVIREAERMNVEAQNALLKTLEEPPGRSCMVLVTSSAGRLLPTIRSRCQLVPFGLLPPTFVREQLRHAARIDDAAATALAGLAQGRLGAALHWHRIGLLTTLRDCSQSLAEGLFASPETFGKRLVALAGDLVDRTIAAGRAEFAPETNGEGADAAENEDAGAAAGSSGAADGDDEPEVAATGSGDKPASGKAAGDDLRDALKLVLMTVAMACREALVLREAAEARVAALVPSDLAPIAAIGRRLSAASLIAGIDGAAEAERLIDRNVAPQLACERLAIVLSDGA